MTASSYYRGYPSATASQLATDSFRASYGHVDATFARSGRRRRPPEPSSRQPLTLTADGGVVEGTGVTESDSRSSGEDEDVSVCSLDVTSSPNALTDTGAALNAQLRVEAS